MRIKRHGARQIDGAKGQRGLIAQGAVAARDRHSAGKVMARCIQHYVIARRGDLGRARNHHSAAVSHIATCGDAEVARNSLLAKNYSVHIGQCHITNTRHIDRAAKVVGCVRHGDRRGVATGGQIGSATNSDHTACGNVAARRDGQIAAQGQIRELDIIHIVDRQVACDHGNRAGEVVIRRQNNVLTRCVDHSGAANGPACLVMDATV